MGSQNEGLEDDSPFKGWTFSGSMLVFWGVIHYTINCLLIVACPTLGAGKSKMPWWRKHSSEPPEGHLFAMKNSPCCKYNTPLKFNIAGGWKTTFLLGR